MSKKGKYTCNRKFRAAICAYAPQAESTRRRNARTPSVAHLGQPLRQPDEALQLPRSGADGLGASAHHVAHVEVALDQRSNRRLTYLRPRVYRQTNIESPRISKGFVRNDNKAC